jgi:putative N6-adenine-specific DNA methylase
MMRENVKKAGELSILVRTYSGLEEVLATEIRKMGGGDAEIITRGVKCSGDLGFIYKLNFSLRTGLRVLMEVGRFRFEHNDAFYKSIYDLPWHEWFDVDKTFRIDSLLFGQHFKNSMFVSQLAKDAIADRFRAEVGRRPFVDGRSADVYISIYVNGNDAVVYLDSSGESLHRRGYKTAQTIAPVSEVLAAGILMISGWTGHFPLIDPMCGSGTFVIEGALMARQIPPGIFRKGFAFEHWKMHDTALCEQIIESVTAKIIEIPLQIMGSDHSRKALEAAKQNAVSAEVADAISFKLTDIADYPVQERKSYVFINPPYGERLQPAELEGLYKTIGSVLKHRFPGSEAWLLTSVPEALHWIGLRPSSKIALFNGDLECRLLRYNLYEGSKKPSKRPG